MNRKGFTLAELLVSLLIIGIVVSVSTPILVREKVSPPEQIWHWTGNNNAIYFGMNDNQQVIINYTGNEDFTGKVIIRPENFNAISFYSHPGNVAVAEHESVLGINYGGRISADDKNIAFGIRTLDNKTDAENNTAIGHFALSDINKVEDSTSVGFSALMSLNNGSRNTAVGYDAGRGFSQGDDNVIIGYNAGLKTTKHDLFKNTIIGSHACDYEADKDDDDADFDISGNICIGYNAAGKYEFDERNSKDRIFIGSDNSDNDISNYIPLIKGYTDFDFGSENPGYDKEIEFNTRKLSVKSDDGEKSMFDFITSRGISGYDISSDIIKGETISKYYSVKGSDDYTGIKTYVNDEISPSVLSMDLSTVGGDDKPVFDINVKYAYADADKESADEKMKQNLLNIDLSRYDEFMVKTLQNDSKLSLSGSGSKIELYNNILNFSMSNPDEPFLIKSKKSIKFFGRQNIHNIGKVVSFESKTGDIKMSRLTGFDSYGDFYAKFFGKSFEITKEPSRGKVHSAYPAFGFNTENGSIQTSGTPTLKAYDTNVRFLLITHINSLSETRCGSSDYGVCIQNLVTEIGHLGYSSPGISSGSSDKRLKNIQGDNISGVNEINKLNVKNYTFKSDEKKEPRVGVIAQELQKVFPNSVFEGKDGYLKIKTEEMFYAAVNSIKQLHLMLRKTAIKITGLEKRINALEKENKKLRKKNEELEKRFKKLEAQKSNKKQEKAVANG